MNQKVKDSINHLHSKLTPIRSSSKKKVKKIYWKQTRSVQLLTGVEQRDKWFVCVFLTVTG